MGYQRTIDDKPAEIRLGRLFPQPARFVLQPRRGADMGKILRQIQAQARNPDKTGSGQLERPLRNFPGKMPVERDLPILR